MCTCFGVVAYMQQCNKRIPIFNFELFSDVTFLIKSVTITLLKLFLCLDVSIVKQNRNDVIDNINTLAKGKHVSYQYDN